MQKYSMDASERRTMGRPPMRAQLDWIRWIALGAALVWSLVAVSPLHAQSYTLAWYTVDGGGRAAGSGFAVQSAIGQVDAGIHTGGGFRLHGGFLGPQQAQTAPDPDPDPAHGTVFLPTMSRLD